MVSVLLLRSAVPNLRLASLFARNTPVSTTVVRANNRFFSATSRVDMIETHLTKLLGIEVPLVQGGMQWVGVPKLAAAVSNAGGLGILTALTQPDPNALRLAIRETRKMTSKPFGVNLTLLPSINPPDYEGYARAAVEEGVRIIETAGNNPGPVINFFKSNGCIVIHKCTTIRHAKSAAKLGVDVLSIDGFECAGHPGEEDIGGLVLLARAAQELKIPYIASGGIADGRGLAAALALGACGANMGTRFMCTVESPIHQNIKDKIVASTESDTVHIFRSLRNTSRVFRNGVAEQVVALERRPGGAKFEDLRELVSGVRGRLVYEKGDPEYGVWTLGVCVGLIKDCPTCEVLVRRIEREAEEVIDGMARMRVQRTEKAKL
ncbi:inosine monophosphate dehydrogenase [Obba rivulosa]|uniref:Inosine monophosphate dehydrogenase n=1 Tax=Obba rivulosa TaxID=1052685 RepID=A0A8E2B135_9APHY|nr:inosine monophosphate dehydrogenase [Obba rivulosa]